MSIEQEDMFPEFLPKSEDDETQLEKQKGLAELEKLEEEIGHCVQCETGYCGRHTDIHRAMVKKFRQG